jgi:hypothetical protein
MKQYTDGIDLGKTSSPGPTGRARRGFPYILPQDHTTGSYIVGLDGGRAGTRTPDLLRVKQAL